MRRFASQDTLLGLCMLAFAALFFLLAQQQPVGTLARMGAAYVPTVLSVMLAALAAIVLAIGLTRETQAPDAWPWRPVACIVGAVLFFGLAIPHLGLPLTSAGALLLCNAAQPGRRIIGTITSALVVSAAASALFVGALRLPIPVWPQWTF